MGCFSDKVKVQGDNDEEDEKDNVEKVGLSGGDSKKDIYRIKILNENKIIKKEKNGEDNNINNQETIPNDRLVTNSIEKEELEDTILGIEKEEMEICNIFNENNKKTKEKEIELKFLSQYFINPKKEKVDFSYSNQMIVLFKGKINPFKEKIDKREDILKIKDKVKQIKDKYNNKKQITIKPISDNLSLDLTQKIEKNYEFKFKYKIWKIIMKKLFLSKNAQKVYYSLFLI